MAKLCIIYDKPGWAFERIAFEIAKHDKRNSYTLLASTSGRSIRRIVDSLESNTNLVHFMWRLNLLDFDLDRKPVFTTAVYDHLFLDQPELTKRLLSGVDFYVSSKKLAQLYEGILPGKAMSICQDGVDIWKFYPHSQIGTRRQLRIGWVGNSKWAGTDNKGFSTIIKQLQHLLRNDDSFSFHLADSQNGYLRHAEMPDFYDSIDVLLCASETEGTPNPILEASAMGRAWISTDVGIVQELTGTLQQQFIVPRSVNAFLDALYKIQNDRALLALLGEENRSRVENGWSWREKSAELTNFFEKSLEK